MKKDTNPLKEYVVLDDNGFSDILTGKDQVREHVEELLSGGQSGTGNIQIYELNEIDFHVSVDF